MKPLINGLHHVTAMAGHPQKNIDFYEGILGLRMLKKTINFDAPSVYHLYYGDETGSPGSIMTFFPYNDLPKGRAGNGQMTLTAFSIPASSLSFWVNRLISKNITFERFTRFDEEVLSFTDFDGLGIELIANATDTRTGWAESKFVPAEFAIKGFHSVTLNLGKREKSVALLTETMGYKLVSEQESRFRFESAVGGVGTYVDVLWQPEAVYAKAGSGTIHHLAFSTSDDQDQLEIREKLLEMRFDVTPVIDRNYFHSIYFREPENILYEIATNPPGFMVDETSEELGKTLRLPAWYESKRSQIESGLIPVHEPEI
ncbi:MAG: ring-cleaving dioxygenase [Verrucomicrobia bacterium]|nr:ring-cleaving dioxygenase [Cytophagales bacterium]